MAGGKLYVVLLTLIAIISLHYVSNMPSHHNSGSALFTLPGSEVNSERIGELMRQRTKLNEEIVLLQHVVEQLRKVDISDLNTPGTQQQPFQQQRQPAQGVPPSWQSPPPQPPSRPPPMSLRQPQHVATHSPPQQQQYQAAATSTVQVVPPPSQLNRVTTPTATKSTPVTSATIQNHDKSDKPTIIYEGETMKSSWRDFPCALRNFKKAQVTTTCEIDCGDAECARAIKVCEGYLECHAIVIKGASRGENLVQASAILKSDSERSRDNSLQLLKASSWFQSTALTTTIKPRYYIVNSYGGCGSKMMAGWLSQLPTMYKKSVSHYHDPRPPQQLHSMAGNKAASPVIKGKKDDFRSGRFPGGSKFKEDSEVVPDSKIDDYRIIFIYKDPVEALVSRYGFGHCMHIQGDCGVEANWPKLDVYASQQKDRMKLIPHFDAYFNPAQKRNYPIIAINYHRVWDNLPALMDALGLPQSMIKTFPPRTETVRNDATGKAEGNNAHTESTRADLRKIYQPLIDKVMSNPAVMVI